MYVRLSLIRLYGLFVCRLDSLRNSLRQLRKGVERMRKLKNLLFILLGLAVLIIVGYFIYTGVIM